MLPPIELPSRPPFATDARSYPLPSLETITSRPDKVTATVAKRTSAAPACIREKLPLNVVPVVRTSSTKEDVSQPQVLLLQQMLPAHFAPFVQSQTLKGCYTSAYQYIWP